MKSVYLDYQATTPTDHEVLKKMLPYFTETFGNPHSTLHKFGSLANRSIEHARYQVAKNIGAKSSEVIFTSGATESNNLAIKGAINYRKKVENRNELIICTTEHKCVLEAAHKLALNGNKITLINVDKDGFVDLNSFSKALNSRVAIVSVMFANNEIGVIQPIKQLTEMCKNYGIWFHTDAAQAIGNIKIDVNNLGIDLMSISGHKVYGPKGVGALYVRRTPRVRLISEIDGGGQEKLIRSGTVPTPLVVGLGEALSLSYKNFCRNKKNIQELRDYLFFGMSKNLDAIIVNGPDLKSSCRLHNNLNLFIKGINANQLVSKLGARVAFSTGSACSTGDIEPSYVLTSMGLSDKVARSSIRLSVGKNTTREEINYAIKVITNEVKALRK